MRAFVTDTDGVVWELPQATAWEMEYGCGTPCDSFHLVCPLEPRQDLQPKTWVTFYAEQDGERVFTGVVDECEVSITGQGCRLELSGRGMAALLLDNEALGQDYVLATLEDVLRDHVTPYGISVGECAGLEPVERFRVETGSSEWTVLYEFAQYWNGVCPRFDQEGRLILAHWQDGEALVLDDTVPVTRLLCRDKRYGVLSEVLVRDRYSGQTEQVKNEEFSALGGRARRVLTMPGHSAAASMRYTGAFQLEESAREQEELEVDVAVPFYAMPGQLVRLSRERSGLYRVLRMETGMDETGEWTKLTLGLPERMR